MQCTHSNQFADVGMLQMNKAEAKRYVEENITIMSMSRDRQTDRQTETETERTRTRTLYFTTIVV